MWASALLAALIAAAPLAAQDATVLPARSPKKSMFWRVSSGDRVAYLLGSIHFGSKAMYPLPAEIEDAFDGSPVLLVEADLKHLDLQKMKALAEYAGGDTLWNHVSRQVRLRLEEFCRKYGFQPAAVARLKPWVVAVMVSTIPKARSGREAGLGIDKYFLDKAETARKRVVEIESAEAQMKLVSRITAEMLEKSVADLAKQDPEESGKQLQQAWMSGDTGEMEKMIRVQTSDAVEFAKAMFEDRNQHMADVAEQFLKGKEQAFVVVGVGHMVGPDGVVRILEKRGYKVEQVTIGGR